MKVSTTKVAMSLIGIIPTFYSSVTFKCFFSDEAWTSDGNANNDDDCSHMSEVQFQCSTEYVYFLTCHPGWYLCLHSVLPKLIWFFLHTGSKSFCLAILFSVELQNCQRVVLGQEPYKLKKSPSLCLYSLLGLAFVTWDCIIGKCCLPGNFEHHFDSCLCSLLHFVSLALVIQR